MTEATNSSLAGRQIFISYSRSDRSRVDGLRLLLEALGHRVFFDKNSIKPGMRWKAKLQANLDQAGVLLIYWTKQARDSDWVRREYEYFHVSFPDRSIVPILGDETELPPLLESQYQHSDFSPLINELLVLKRDLESDGIKPPQIQEAILKRLNEAGIEINTEDRRKLFKLFAPIGFLALLAEPLALLQWIGNIVWEAAVQLSAAQVALVGAAAVSGMVVCQIIEQATLDILPGPNSPAGFNREKRRPNIENLTDKVMVGGPWEGVWDLTDHGNPPAYRLMLEQDGDKVSGESVRGSEKGSFDGTVRGGVLAGEWSSQDLHDPHIEKFGTFKLTMDSTKQNIRGTYLHEQKEAKKKYPGERSFSATRVE